MGKEILSFIFTTRKRSVSVRAFEKRERKIEKAPEDSAVPIEIKKSEEF